MSTFLEEKREAAQDPTNNTAQEQLLDFLETLHPAITELIFPEPLTGDIDFHILKECNFTNITAIRIPEGNITSIRNLPDFITELSCPKNILTELEDLPPRLVLLDIQGNGLKRLDFRKLDSLRTLNISNNEFVDIRSLPSSLEHLYCNNNLINTLDLEGIDNLQTLHCMNNKMLVIVHFPDTITDLKMEHNPNIERLREGDIENSEKTPLKNSEEIVTIQESLKQYFKLKNKYESARLKSKRDLYKTAKENGLGKKAIVNRLASMKTRCVNCGNPGNPQGTIFTLENRTYTAICGCLHPCNLNIRIFAGVFSDIYHYLRTFHDAVEDSKSATIQHKLDSLFNYVDEKTAVKIFKETLEEYTTDNTILKEVTREYNNIYENEERTENQRKKHYEVEEIKSKTRDLLKEYSETGIRSVLTAAMELYANELQPAIQNFRYLKNEIMEVNILDNKRILFQNSIELSKMDYTFNEPSKVERFII
jgi:hypothetical protein